MTMTTINTTISMTSREIAEVTGKQHRNVMADIRKMVNDLTKEGIEIGVLSFQQSSYINSQNKQQPMLVIDKDLTMNLILSYSAPLRFKVIKRVGELEAENKMLTEGMVAITQTETLEAAHGIAEEVLARRELLRNSYKGEVTEVLTNSFKNHTSGGGRNIGQVMMNHAKLISLVATGFTPCVFKKEHDGMAPRDWAVATQDLELIEALTRAEAKVLALSEAGMSYSDIKSILIKD